MTEATIDLPPTETRSRARTIGRAIGAPVIGAVIGLLIGALLILIAGANVVESYTAMLRGAFGGPRSLQPIRKKANPPRLGT